MSWCSTATFDRHPDLRVVFVGGRLHLGDAGELWGWTGSGATQGRSAHVARSKPRSTSDEHVRTTQRWRTSNVGKYREYLEMMDLGDTSCSPRLVRNGARPRGVGAQAVPCRQSERICAGKPPRCRCPRRSRCPGEQPATAEGRTDPGIRTRFGRAWIVWAGPNFGARRSAAISSATEYATHLVGQRRTRSALARVASRVRRASMSSALHAVRCWSAIDVAARCAQPWRLTAKKSTTRHGAKLRITWWLIRRGERDRIVHHMESQVT